MIVVKFVNYIVIAPKHGIVNKKNSNGRALWFIHCTNTPDHEQ